jgi:enoyl-CoA hydratase
MDDLLLVERDGPVATLTLNRPAVLNALNTALLGQLERVLAELDADPDLRVAILTGSGERAFAAGADISELNALPTSHAAAEQARLGQRVTLALERAHFPVIAAVNGFALGGGCELALACDLRIASENARFGQPEVNLGVIPGFGGTQRTSRQLGTGSAMFLCLTGEMIDAPEALRIGLVQRVVPLADLLAQARQIAGIIASKAPLAVAATKRAILDGGSLGMREALELEALHFGVMAGTADFREGTRAFLDKRKPDFQGH